MMFIFLKLLAAEEIKDEKQNKMHKIKVAFILLEFLGGGSERVTELLTRELSLKENLELFIITTTREISNNISPRVKIIIIPTNTTDAIQTLINIKKNYGIDIFVCQDYWKAINAQFIDILKSFGAKVIAFEHNSFFTYLYYAGTERSDLKYKMMKAYAKADALICLSRTDARIWSLLGAREAIYIPNLLTFEPSKFKAQLLTNKNVLFNGRFDLVQKRPHVAIEVFAKVYQHHPDARLQILGNQDEQYKQYCQRLTTRLNVTKAVDFIGYQKDIQPILKNSAVMIMTSQFEGFPMVIPEAKTFGIPIVMMKLDYCEVTQEGVINVEKNNIDAMAEQLKLLLDDVSYRRKKGREAKESLVKFSNADIVSRWDKLIKAVMEGDDQIKELIQSLNQEISDEIVAQISEDEQKHALLWEEFHQTLFDENGEYID
ncbi:Glycosyl_transferases group 1 family protein [Hexamita inflata]|uniref:Glycosyl transferases group 1 family protein n=1 Tax=Hexamita inflata TaxID=28002 RepID=A0AA86TIF3_9EUKA|nr:Glycosyl transferases group 1 family protein [Hexamita inflata]